MGHLRCKGCRIALEQCIAYCHITRDVNCIVDNIARWVLDTRVTIAFWDKLVLRMRQTASYRISTSNRA